MILCHLCTYWFDPDWIETHLIEDHSQEPVERWPDGAPVVVDLTLTPEDFIDA